VTLWSCEDALLAPLLAATGVTTRRMTQIGLGAGDRPCLLSSLRRTPERMVTGSREFWFDITNFYGKQTHLFGKRFPGGNTPI